MSSALGEPTQTKSRGRFSELLKVEAKLALRQPSVFGMGFGLPVILLLVFGFIGKAQPGNAGNTGLTIIDLYVPTIIVIGFVLLGTYVLPYTMVTYREIGWLKRVSTTPVHPSRLLAAQLIINLVLAVATILIVIFGSEIIFGARPSVNIPFFTLSIILSVAEIFSIGLLVGALVPSQAAARLWSGLLAFLLFFLSGLWTPSALVGGPLAMVINYSPSGAAVQALLYSAFNSAPPYTAIVTVVVYALVFAFIAIRYFRWE